ncbi:ABC transporter ATP-binding protein [Blastococcus sp. SYSU DS0753]
MIEFRSVSKQYPDGTTAIDDLSLTVASHETVVLVGSSGSGKTTLLRMANRMVEPTAGAVLIDEQDVRGRNPVELRRSIGYVLQAGGLLPHRTVADNVATVPLLSGARRREARTRALELLELVGLEPALAARYPAQLSGGQQQRVGVARALAGDPDVLLMDEPFGAVDPIVRADLQTQLRDLQTRLGKTILFVTHDIDEAFALADRVVVLRAGGRIAQVGSPVQLLTRPADGFVADFVGSGTAKRSLRTVEVDGQSVLVDGDGRPAGVLVP